MISNSLYSSRTEMWETPQDFFDKLNSEFNFNLDPCAVEENAKCERYFTPIQDGLKQDWGGVQCVLQSTVRERHSQMVQEMLRRKQEAWYYCCYAYTRPDRYQMVSRLGLWKSRITICTRKVKIWGLKKFSTFSVNGSYFQK